MEPTLTAAFVTIVKLLAIFKHEREGTNHEDHQAFMEWLEYHRHDDIKNFICNTALVQNEVNNLFRADHATILAKLDSMEGILAALLSRVEGFTTLAAIILPKAPLSDQAVSILRQAVASPTGCISYKDYGHNGIHLHFDDGKHIQVEEPRLIPDDLDTFAALGLTRLDSLESGYQTYRITRAAVEFVKSLDPEPAATP